jgi:hypothetical protein
MRQISKLADRMLTRFVPKATAAACPGCSTTPYHFVGPCQGGYWASRTCCYYAGPGNPCMQYCTYNCP